MKSTVENLALWEQRIKERAQTGMTIEDWCNENGASKHQYHYWNKRIREKQKPGKEMVFSDVSSMLSMNPTLSTLDKKVLIFLKTNAAPAES